MRGEIYVIYEPAISETEGLMIKFIGWTMHEGVRDEQLGANRFSALVSEIPMNRPVDDG